VTRAFREASTSFRSSSPVPDLIVRAAGVLAAQIDCDLALGSLRQYVSPRGQRDEPIFVSTFTEIPTPAVRPGRDAVPPLVTRPSDDDPFVDRRVATARKAGEERIAVRLQDETRPLPIVSPLVDSAGGDVRCRNGKVRRKSPRAWDSPSALPRWKRPGVRLVQRQRAEHRLSRTALNHERLFEARKGRDARRLADTALAQHGLFERSDLLELHGDHAASREGDILAVGGWLGAMLNNGMPHDAFNAACAAQTVNNGFV
jgi:hypothetical protein